MLQKLSGRKVKVQGSPTNSSHIQTDYNFGDRVSFHLTLDKIWKAGWEKNFTLDKS